jgi:phage replication O-like protein O
MGYRKTIMNPMLEAVARADLIGSEFRIFAVVLRASLGWDREHCDRLTARGIARQIGWEWGGRFRAVLRSLERRGMIKCGPTIKPVLDPALWEPRVGGAQRRPG